MKSHNVIGRWAAIAGVFLGLLAGAGTALAHCDTLDAPVVAAARQALETGNVQDVGKLISQRMEEGLHRQFEEVMKKKNTTRMT
jgi:hypothetical protein